MATVEAFVSIRFALVKTSAILIQPRMDTD
jgi:hypothetical protein